jgi:hypothetical protein
MRTTHACAMRGSLSIAIVHHHSTRIAASHRKLFSPRGHAAFYNMPMIRYIITHTPATSLTL